MLYPDKGEFEFWTKKANELKEQGFRISVSDLIEQLDYKQGFDLADYYLKELETETK